MSIEAVIKTMSEAMGAALAKLQEDGDGQAIVAWMKDRGLADALTFQESTILGVLAGKLVGAGCAPEDVGVYVALSMKLVDGQTLVPPPPAKPPLRAV